MRLVLAALSLMCTPMPFLFMRYGPYLRRKSQYAPSVPVTPPPVPGAAASTGVATNGTANGEKVDQREDEALEPEWAVDAGEHAGVKSVEEAA